MSSIQRQHPRRAIECSPAVQFRILLWLFQRKCFSKHRNFCQTDSNGKNTWKTENPSFHPSFHRFPEMCRSNRCHPVGRATSEATSCELFPCSHFLFFLFPSMQFRLSLFMSLSQEWAKRMWSLTSTFHVAIECNHAIMIHARFLDLKKLAEVKLSFLQRADTRKAGTLDTWSQHPGTWVPRGSLQH